MPEHLGREASEGLDLYRDWAWDRNWEWDWAGVWGWFSDPYLVRLPQEQADA